MKLKHALIALAAVVALVAGFLALPQFASAVGLAAAPAPVCVSPTSSTVTEKQALTYETCRFDRVEALVSAPPVTVTATTTTTATATATVTATTTATVTATPTAAPTSATPTPTPTPTPTSTPTSQPAAFPDASNTGVPAGTTLHACDGNITTAGTYDSCDFPGNVVIHVAGVTISKSMIRGQVGGDNEDLHGVHIVDSEINCGCQSTDNNNTPAAIMSNNFTLTRVNIHNAGHAAAIASNVTIEDSWLHGLGGNTTAHKDAIWVGDGHDSVIRHNTITCDAADGCTSAVGLLVDFGPISRFTIDGNLLNDNGSYCFYGGSAKMGKSFSADHITFTNNVFGRALHQQCGNYGPVVYFDSAASLGNVWTNNTWVDGGAVQPAN